MNRSEQTIVLAVAGLGVAGVGTFLPWARIGGRNRSGYDTADTFISLAAGVLPDVVAWVGRAWYAPALLTIALFALAFLASSRPRQVVASGLAAVSLTLWWSFVWAGNHYGVLNVKLAGPIVSTVGVLVLLAVILRPHTAVFAYPGNDN